jgi:hypothetical protein
MTAAELLAELTALLAEHPEAADLPVHIAVQTETQVYPAGYFPIWGGVHLSPTAHAIRIRTTLSEGFYIGERKARR